MNIIFLKFGMRILCFWILSMLPGILTAQDILIHSHNDYRQTVPFYQSYAQKVASIEADIYATGRPGELLVAHDRDELPVAPTLDESYLQPIVNLYRQNNGRPWKKSNNRLVLLIDLKTPVDPALGILVEKLKQYPEVFDPAVNPYAVRVVISGNRPDPAIFGQYPSLIAFDGDKTDYTAAQLERIAMVSLNFRDYSHWNGKGTMVKEDYDRVMKAVADVHALGKPVRFWGTPDGITAWNTFHNMGIDYINTDRPEECRAFFHNFGKKTYQIAAVQDALPDDVARAERLDKTTSGFRGFRNKDLQLSENIAAYTPRYRNDGADTPVRNVILLIGDGMGLAQVCAANTVNRGLTILNMKHIGLQQTHSEDAYTTDSAAAGSGLATGRKNNNRHIAMSATGEAYPSLTDAFHQSGYACGVVTLGNAADATPAAFYGHSTERDNSDEITRWLLDGKLTLLCGSGMEIFTDRKDGIDLISDLKSEAAYTFRTSIDEINGAKGKVICIDERMEKAATQETLSLLADATQQAIRKLTGESRKGFFLMVEGAKIDYAGHANSLPGSILETLSFDMAVAEALRFADSNGETLVIVTGDHETGGLTLVDGNRTTGEITVQYVTDDHTPVMLPVYVYGPKAGKFTGVYQNTDINHRIREVAEIK